MVLIQIAAAVAMKFLANDTCLAMHRTEPQPQLGGRGLIVPQGRVLGGGSTVNAMVYMRGQAADYDLWNAAVTAPGAKNDGAWSYRDLLPYFKAQEDNDHLTGEFHGVGGPLKISNLGHTGPMTFPYPLAKHALLGMTKALGIEYAGQGVRVNALAPGYVRTQKVVDYWNSFPDPAEAAATTMRLHPGGRIAMPEEIAKAVLFMIWEECPFMNATCLTVDGSMTVLHHP